MWLAVSSLLIRLSFCEKLHIQLAETKGGLTDGRACNGSMMGMGEVRSYDKIFGRRWSKYHQMSKYLR